MNNQSRGDRLPYQDQESPLTLREGLAQYYASNPNLIDPSQTSTHEMTRYFANHDASHVAFGTNTSIEDELLNDVWTFFAVDVKYRYYVGELAKTKEEASKVISDLSSWKSLWGGLKGFGLLLVRVPALVWRSRQMTRKWPWQGWEVNLDRPLSDLRREYGLRVF